MSLSCTPTQYIENAAAPNSTYPYSAGMWLRPATVAAGARFAFNVGQNVTRNSLLLGMSASAFICSADNGTTGADASAGTGVVGSWSYVIGRWISATNRRIVVLNPTGALSVAQDTTNITISSLTRLRVGQRADNFSSPNQAWNGEIADLWYADVDIQEDGGALTSGLAEQLAYGGPFSCHHLRHHIREFISFRAGIGTPDTINRREYYGKLGPQTWTSSGPPTIRDHAPRSARFAPIP